MKFILTLWLSKLLAFGVNLVDKRRGSNYSGQFAIKLMPNFVKHFKGIDYDKVIFITGTNGKSTTTNLVNHVLRSAGKSVACNVEGANMMGGVATVLIKNSTLFGKLNKEFLVLEIDERSLPGIRSVLPGRHMGITNLQKDQMQRNGDPDFILRKFQKTIGSDMTLYLNNEEPRSKSLEDCAGSAVYFSVSENERTYTRRDFYTVTMPCPKCGHPIRYKQYNLANIGPFACSHCQHGSEAKPDVEISKVDFSQKTFRCNGSDYTVTYSDPFYIYNYAMAIALGSHFGLTPQELQAAFSSFQNPATHNDIFSYGGKEIHFLRGKQENPEALQSQLDIIAQDKRQKTVCIGMYPVADFLPHYCGSFYFFDCDFGPIAAGNVEQYVAFSSAVSYDLASRMVYAGVPEEKITVLGTSDPYAVLKKLQDTKAEVVYFLTNTKHFADFKKAVTQGGQKNG